MKKPARELRGRKGTIGSHGTCEKCGTGRYRKHNAYWCPSCRFVEHCAGQKKDS